MSVITNLAKVMLDASVIEKIEQIVRIMMGRIDICMSEHSFICNGCSNINKNKESCEKCNGSGMSWEPVCKENYEKNPQEYIKRLILGSQ